MFFSINTKSSQVGERLHTELSEALTEICQQIQQKAGYMDVATHLPVKASAFLPNSSNVSAEG